MKWRTKDGRKISIKELTDRHLIFILLFLRKHAERELISTQIFYSTGDFDDLPDGAWMAVQSEIAEAEDAE